MRPGSVLFMVGTLVGSTQAFLPTTRPLLPSCQRVAAAPAPRGLHMSSLFEEEDKTGQRIRDGLLVRFLPEDIKRVLDSWDRMVANKPFEDKANQRYAQSYVEGLSAKPWHELSEHPWAAELEKSAAVVQEELKEALNLGPALEQSGNNVWVGSANVEGTAYGPDWKTLVLQDRQWDETNTRIFPKTTELLKSINAPTVEVFFAKQKAKTGIQPHSDNTNFILTAHLGLDVPEGKCWIRVGGEKREWRNGKALVFDTHYLHDTANDGDKDRYVLLIRFWHPQLTQKEREALLYIFKALEGEDTQTDLDYDYFEQIAAQQLSQRAGAGNLP